MTSFTSPPRSSYFPVQSIAHRSCYFHLPCSVSDCDCMQFPCSCAEQSLGRLEAKLADWPSPLLAAGLCEPVQGNPAIT